MRCDALCDTLITVILEASRITVIRVSQSVIARTDFRVSSPTQ